MGGCSVDRMPVEGVAERKIAHGRADLEPFEGLAGSPCCNTLCSAHSLDVAESKPFLDPYLLVAIMCLLRVTTDRAG